MNEIKCECPERGTASIEFEDMYSEAEKSGMKHDPYKCPCTNELKKYRRGNKELWLCSCCNLMGDILVKEFAIQETSE